MMSVFCKASLQLRARHEAMVSPCSQDLQVRIQQHRRSRASSGFVCLSTSWPLSVAENKSCALP